MPNLIRTQPLFPPGHGIIHDLAVEYIPRGGMCMTCKKLSFVSECAQLPFHTMRVSKVYDDGTKAVICSEYVREPK